MYCINDTLYLEESAAEVWNITKLSEESKFCSAVFTFIRLTSIPLGLGIIIINYLAFKSISNQMRTHLVFGGNAVTLKGIAFLDILNGCFVLVYFMESAMGCFFQGNKTVWKVEVWLSWLCIYSSVLLRLYLCCQRLYSYGMLLLTAENANLLPDSQRKSYKICSILFVVANVELATVLLTQYCWQDFFKNRGMYTIPFLLIQDVAVFIVCVLSICILVFSRLRAYSHILGASALLPLCLISLSSVITNIVTFYGDVLCISRRIPISNQALLDIKPECFIPFAKTLTYFDSLFFPLILFTTSRNLRRSLKVIICGVQPAQLMQIDP